MAVEKRVALSGNTAWRELMNVIEAGRGGGDGRVPRGGHAVGASPTEPMTQLPEAWDTDVQSATHVVYHYGTPIAWRDADGWVVPEKFYSPSTTGVQNRIRNHLGAGNFRTTVKV